VFVSAGVGALYLRRRPRVRVVPVQSGGGQERGIRSGTVPTPLAVGLGTACELAQREMDVSMWCTVLNVQGGTKVTYNRLTVNVQGGTKVTSYSRLL